MKQEDSKTLQVFTEKLILQPRRDYPCYGCGSMINKPRSRKYADGTPNHSGMHLCFTGKFEGERKPRKLRLCLICGMLAYQSADETNSSLIPLMFKEPYIANRNRKRLAELRKRIAAGEAPYQMFKEMVKK